MYLVLDLPGFYQVSFVAKSLLEKIAKAVLFLHQWSGSIQYKSSQMTNNLMFFCSSDFKTERLDRVTLKKQTNNNNKKNFILK